MYILAINPGASSTKFALFNDEQELMRDDLKIPLEKVESYKTLEDQLEDRYVSIYDALVAHGFDPKKVEIAVGRGGILPPVEAGAIAVTDTLIDYLLHKAEVIHPANLGASIAQKFVDQAENCTAYIYDPISVDQMDPIARISGLKGIERKSIGHMLNSRAVAIEHAKSLQTPYNKLNMIVVHAGSGITVTAHKQGRMIDLVGDDEGAFSPERSGGLPLRPFMNLCYNNDKEAVTKLTRHQGGLISYFETNDVRSVEAMIEEGHDEAALVLEAMAYQIAKSIGTLSTVLEGKVDSIVISGGFARSNRMMNWIEERVSFIAPVAIYPGEFELEALASGGLRAFHKLETTHYFE